jgi:DNA-binding LacI/PurR family transcriptional regulator
MGTIRAMQAQFLPLPAQVAASIRQKISSEHIQLLPSERRLAVQLQVSRPTIRKALAILRADGFIKTQGRRAFTSQPRRAGGPKNRHIKINFLLPDPLAQSLPYATLWIHFVTELLQANDYQFEIISGRKYYGAQTARSLSNLVAGASAQCWVLTRTNHAIQQWFNDRGIPAIVAGSAYPSITLPSVDTDHAAISHHAVSTFLRNGHLRIALFFEKLRHAGDMEMERGFRAGLAGRHDTHEPIISRIERTPKAVIQELQRLLSLSYPPTGLLFSEGFTYLTAQSYLNSLGYLVPRDFSMISEDEGPFLAHLYPEPARYVGNAAKFAMTINRVIKQTLTGHIPGGLKVRIMPDFIPGASVGPMREIAPRRR